MLTLTHCSGFGGGGSIKQVLVALSSNENNVNLSAKLNALGWNDGEPADVTIAVSSGVLVGVYGWPPVLALLTGAVVVGLLAFLVAKPILRLKGHYLAMATLGIGIIVSIVLRTESGLTGGPDGMMVEPFKIFGVELYGEKVWYWVVGVLLVGVVWLSLNLIDSPMGRALRAVHGSEVAAEVVGVDTARFKVLVFVVSAVFASVPGSLFAHYTGLITPAKADFFKSIELVTMVVFGGMASTFGAVVGAVVLTLLPQALTVFQDYQQIVLGGILMATMVFMASLYHAGRRNRGQAGFSPVFFSSRFK